jgi:hypothetical protein
MAQEPTPWGPWNRSRDVMHLPVIIDPVVAVRILFHDRVWKRKARKRLRKHVQWCSEWACHAEIICEERDLGQEKKEGIL